MRNPRGRVRRVTFRGDVPKQNHGRAIKNSIFIPNRTRSSSEFYQPKVNRILLTLFGLWPEQMASSKRRNLFVYTVCSTSLMAPLVQALTENAGVDPVIKFGTACGFLWVLGSLIFLASLFISEDSLAKLHRKNALDYGMMKTTEELDIMRLFSEEAGSFMSIFMGCGFVSGSLFFIMNYCPFVYESWDAYSSIYFTYSYRWIVDDKSRGFQIFAHTSLVLIYCGLAYASALCVYMYNVKHACGVFTIVSHRLQRLVMTGSANESDGYIDAALLEIIVMHREAIKSTHIVRKIYCRVLYGLQLLSMILLAILIFVLKLGVSIRSPHLAFRVISISTMFMQYILSMNYGGQQIIECSSKVFEATHLMNWDDLSPKARKVLLMIMLRSCRPDLLRGGTVTLSMSNITKIINMSWSLATVLWSMQKNS